MYIGASPFKERNVSSMIVYVTRCRSTDACEVSLVLE